MTTDVPSTPDDHPAIVVPEVDLFGRVHTPEQVEYLAKWCACPACGKRPESVDPLPGGWVWDCRAFTRWAWCPDCRL